LGQTQFAENQNMDVVGVEILCVIEA